MVTFVLALVAVSIVAVAIQCSCLFGYEASKSEESSDSALSAAKPSAC